MTMVITGSLKGVPQTTCKHAGGSLAANTCIKKKKSLMEISKKYPGQQETVKIDRSLLKMFG